MILPTRDLDAVLTAQLAVAWAGETGEEERRLGWWRTDLVSEFGGRALFQSVLPSTWPWATLQAVRHAARRRDSALRQASHDPDQVYSLFRLGFAMDERVDDRLQTLKRSGRSVEEALPTLHKLIRAPWSRARFMDWVDAHGPATTTTAPVGRLLGGPMPSAVAARMDALVAGLSPLSDQYPLPHFRSEL